MRYVFFVFVFCSFSRLPPLYQGITEIEAICKELPKHLSSAEVIQEIIRIEGGYAIFTSQKTLYVAVLGKEKRKIGPKDFDLQFSFEPF